MKQKLNKKELRRISAVFIACIVLLLGCGGAAKSSSADYAAAGSYYAPSSYEEYEVWSEEAYDSETAAAIQNYTGEGNTYHNDTVKQKLIQNIYATVRVENPAEAADSIKEYAEGTGGYLLNSVSNYNSETNNGYAELTIRIPTGTGDQMKAFLGEIGKIESTSTDAQDVTNEYYDLQIRIEQGKEELKQLNELLARCETIEEVLAVRNQISYLQSEVESMEGQYRRLSELTSYDTMYITLYPVVNLVETKDEGRFMTFTEFWSGLLNGLKTSLRVVVNGLGYVLIFLATILLPLLVFGGIIYGVVRLIIFLVKKSNGKKRAKRQKKAEEKRRQQELRIQAAQQKAQQNQQPPQQPPVQK